MKEQLMRRAVAFALFAACCMCRPAAAQTPFSNVVSADDTTRAVADATAAARSAFIGAPFLSGAFAGIGMGFTVLAIAVGARANPLMAVGPAGAALVLHGASQAPLTDSIKLQLAGEDSVYVAAYKRTYKRVLTQRKLNSALLGGLVGGVVSGLLIHHFLAHYT